MSGVIINNTTDSSDTVVLTGETVLNRLNDFKTSITTKGTVSRSEILSLEEFIGAAVITSSVDINSISEMETSVGLHNVERVVDDIIEKVNVNDTITVDSVIELIYVVGSEVENLLHTFKRFKKINPDVIERSKNESIILRFDENDVLVDATTWDLFYFTNYKLDILKNIFGENLNTDLITASQDTHYILLSAIKSLYISVSYYKYVDIVIEPITLRDVLNMVEKPQQHIERFEELLVKIKCDVKELSNGTSWETASYQQLKRLRHHYSNLLGLLKDKPSHDVLFAIRESITI